MKVSNYDNWKLDTPDNHEKVFCYCDECNEPIYVGEDYIKLGYDGAKLHTEGECFEYYVERLVEPEVKEAK
jgi:hypothetical protein